MIKKRTLIWLMLLTAFLFQGCSGAGFPRHHPITPRDEEGLKFFFELNRITRLYEAGDASRFPIAGFPYLRTDRFLAAISNNIDGSEQERYWLQRLQQSDLESRSKEIANLPQEALTEIAGRFGIEASAHAVFQQALFFSKRLMETDGRDPSFSSRLKQAVRVPDEYSSFMRWAGLYPLAGIPVTIATSMAYARYRKWHAAEPHDLPPAGRFMRFAPPPQEESSVQESHIGTLFDSAKLDPFGLPKLSPADILLLVKKFAPVVTQDVNAPYDRFGMVKWRQNRVVVDGERPAAYYYLSYAFFRGKPALQLNYVLWYTERAGAGTPWMEKGPLDGLTYRLTLDSSGEAVMIDIMNNCGCYYFFVPRKAHIRKFRLKPGEMEPLVPAWMPLEFPQKRIQLQVNSGWHQVQHIGVADADAAAAVYRLLPYETLESLPKENGDPASVFTSRGIMKDSWRVEPYLFFSMGVAKVGYMRQRGHHAIKLVGREHFTNPFLFDKNFEYNP